MGVRLVDGGIGFRAGLTVLVLSPELYAPIRSLAAQFHASADDAAVAGRLLDLIEAAPVIPTGSERAPDLTAAGVRFENVSCVYSGPAVARCRRARPRARPRGDGRACRAERRRQVHGCDAASRSRGAQLGPGERGRNRRPRLLARDTAPQIAWIPQATGASLRASVNENIRLADPGASAARVREAAVNAGADRFVHGLPEGYDTIVGDGGRPLSAGQTQRIALARAYLRAAPVVVLDEPTANLDPETAELVADAIERLLEGSTVLLITHRAELVRRADRVVQVESGRVVGELARVST